MSQYKQVYFVSYLCSHTNKLKYWENCWSAYLISSSQRNTLESISNLNKKKMPTSKFHKSEFLFLLFSLLLAKLAVFEPDRYLLFYHHTPYPFSSKHRQALKQTFLSDTKIPEVPKTSASPKSPILAANLCVGFLLSPIKMLRAAMSRCTTLKETETVFLVDWFLSNVLSKCWRSRNIDGGTRYIQECS